MKRQTMRFVGPPTLKVIWINFFHLFMVWLLPFATAWIARTRLTSSPVVFYAGLFVCIDITYNAFEREVLTHAMLVAFIAPRVGFGLICGALILHLRPGAPGQPAVTVLRGPHKSMTTSRTGCEQQTRTFPSAGFSRGSGP